MIPIFLKYQKFTRDHFQTVIKQPEMEIAIISNTFFYSFSSYWSYRIWISLKVVTNIFRHQYSSLTFDHVINNLTLFKNTCLIPKKYFDGMYIEKFFRHQYSKSSNFVKIKT